MRSPKALAPTLWRTCRVLMNEERLRLFKTVVEHPDEMNVSQIARCLEIPQPHATSTYALCEPTNPIAKELVRQVLGGSQDYFNNAKGTEENLRLLGNREDGHRFVVVDSGV